MKFIDMFSGIGGFRLGMEMAKHECVGHIEIDKYADRSYRAMHKVKGSEFYATDICGVQPEDLPEADVYCGGFPCQSFSIAGKRGGFEDTRGTLFSEIMRLAKVRKPKYLFLENVRGLLSHDGGQTFGVILTALAECGYDAEWQVLNSKYHGKPHSRSRVFIIGHLRGKCTQHIFPIREKDAQLKIKIIDNVAKNSRERGNVHDICGIAQCMMATCYKDPHKIRLLNGVYRRLTEKEYWRLQGFPDEYFERAAKVNSNSQLYRQAGNAVTVPVVYDIAKRL